MKNSNVFLLTLVMTLFLVVFVSASATVTINTADNSEFNSLTPSIRVTAVGNCSGYNLNVTANGAVVVTSTIANNTATNFTTSSLTASTSYAYNATAWNTTCDSGISNTSTDLTMEINAQPSVSSVAKSTGSNLLVGNTLTWTARWADTNSTGNDSVKVYVCKTNAFTTSCTGGQWSASAYEIDGTTTASYTILTSDTGGQKNYYVFLLDNNNYASSSSSGTFTVSRPVDESEDVTTLTTTTSTGDDSEFPLGWVAVIAIVIIAVVLVIRKK